MISNCGKRHSIELAELHLELEFQLWNTFLSESWQVLVVRVTESYGKKAVFWDLLRDGLRYRTAANAIR